MDENLPRALVLAQANVQEEPAGSLQAPQSGESPPERKPDNAGKTPATGTPRFSNRQTLFLLTHASNPLTTVHTACQAMAERYETRAPGASTVRGWRKWAAFREMHDAIRQDPQVAASFLLTWSQPDAIATWRRNLKEGARVSTDAARALATEHRLRGEGKAKAKLADLIARALESQGLT